MSDSDEAFEKKFLEQEWDLEMHRDTALEIWQAALASCSESPNSSAVGDTLPAAKILIDRVITDLEGGFVACNRCGDQEDTKTLDCMSDLKALQRLLSDGGAVPEVCDGKEQEAFEVYASGKGYDMATHPLHYLFINDKTNAARRSWAAAISYCNSVATAPQQPAKEQDALPTETKFPCWSCREPVSMSERSEADGDCPECGAELDLDLWPAPPTGSE